MDSIIDRILKFCDSMGMNISSFASSIDVNQVTLNNYKLGKRKPSLELVEKVTKKYPQVSAEWLLRGIGNMFDGCGCTPPENPSLYSRTSSAPGTIGSTEAQRTHNGGTTEAERIKELEAMVAERDRVIADQAVRLSRYENKQ